MSLAADMLPVAVHATAAPRRLDADMLQFETLLELADATIADWMELRTHSARASMHTPSAPNAPGGAEAVAAGVLDALHAFDPPGTRRPILESYDEAVRWTVHRICAMREEAIAAAAAESAHFR